MKAERRFPADPRSVPAARRFALGALSVTATVQDRVAIMVSELATNAVLYGRTAFEVCVEQTDSWVQVEVGDFGEGVPQLQPLPPPSELHGRGLRIVDELADRWGVVGAGSAAGKRVWFQISSQ
jgi:anti-sigma regulatory factor (Ser/Thr protein kinase)